MPRPPFATFSLGRWFFGLATLASGMVQILTGDFVRLAPKPSWLTLHPAGAYLAGAVLVTIGIAILSAQRVRTAASVLAVLLVANVLLLHLPQTIVNPVVDRPFLRGFMWTNPLKCLALVGGAALLAGRSDRGIGRLEPWGPALLAAFLIVCGMQHFAYRDFVTAMVPAWMPGQRFWTYFTGVALMAGGAGLLVPRTARLAAGLSAVMIFLWVLMLHIPRALTGPNHANETAGVFEALALSGVALLVAGTRKA